MRHLTLVGRVFRNTKVIKLARRCSWCRRFASEEDYIAAHQDGARVRATICDSCASRWETECGGEFDPTAGGAA